MKNIIKYSHKFQYMMWGKEHNLILEKDKSDYI